MRKKGDKPVQKKGKEDPKDTMNAKLSKQAALGLLSGESKHM